MSQVINESRKITRLPVINGEAPRPVFGSPDNAKYGAVGLDLSFPEEPSPSVSSDGMPSTKSADGKKDTFQIRRNEPLPMVSNISYHAVDEDHLWIGVDDGMVIVPDNHEHEAMKAFVEGCSPAVAAARVESATGLDKATAWRVTASFLGRLAAMGFIQGIKGYHTVKKIRPYAFARFHLTQRCQLECIHCYTDSSPHLSDENELSVERWIKLVDDFADNGGQKILFTGGEALVYKGCIDVMRRAYERGLEVTLFSNGILIPRYLEELKKVTHIVQISVDGPTAESHDAVRGNGSFKKAMRAIRMLLDAGIETRVSTTIMTNNWGSIKEDLPNFIEEFKDTKLGYRISYGAMSHGRGTDLDHNLNTLEVRDWVDGLLSRVKTTENREEGHNAVQKISGCGYAEQLVIAPDGVVYPCHLLSGALGHVDDLPLKDITRYLVKTAKAFSVDGRQGCGTCDLRNLCGGTCRVEDEKHTGSRFVTTCTPGEKLRKKRYLVRRYQPVAAAE